MNSLSLSSALVYRLRRSLAMHLMDLRHAMTRAFIVLCEWSAWLPCRKKAPLLLAVSDFCDSKTGVHVKKNTRLPFSFLRPASRCPVP